MNGDKIDCQNHAELAIYLQPSPIFDDPRGIFGRDIAVTDFLAALLRHGRPGLYRFVTPTLPNGQTSFEPGDSRHDIRTESISLSQLLEQARGDTFAVWHDLDGLLAVASRIRNRISRSPYPITGTPHVLSYPGKRSLWILELLLADIREYDSIICTSFALRSAIELLLDQVSENLAQRGFRDTTFKGRLDVLPLGVDTIKFNVGMKHHARRDLGISESSFVILWVGRISPSDKADLLPLLAVFARLVSSKPDHDIRLIIAGSGESRLLSALEGRVRELGLPERVKIIQPLTPDKRHTVYAAADVFVSPAENIQETFGITPIEAMASGLPQVVSDWSGYRETVVHMQTGLLVPTYFPASDSEAALRSGLYDGHNLDDHLILAQSTVVDPDALEFALRLLLEDDDLRIRMSNESRLRAVKEFDWQKIVARYEALWDMLVPIARSSPPQAPALRDYAEPNFRAIFEHFATSTIPTNLPAFITSSGRSILAGHQRLPGYGAPYDVIRVDVALLILDRIDRNPGASIRLITGAVANDNRLRADNALRHAAWLMKHGLVRIQQADDSPG